MKRYFSFDGRISRGAYLRASFVLFGFSIGIVAVWILLVFAGLTALVFVILLPVYCAVGFAGIALSSRRCHDLNRSMWFMLIPLYGFVLLFARGNKNDNRFGSDPRLGNGGDSTTARHLPKTRTSEKIGIIVATMAISAVLQTATKTFLVEAWHIPTESMERTLTSGDYVLVNKAEFAFSDITTWLHRGDVVTFHYRGDRDEALAPSSVNYIKRCVALPGDMLELRNRMLFVNGTHSAPPATAVISPRAPSAPGAVDGRIFPIGRSWNLDNYGPLRVPKRGDVISLNDSMIAAWTVFILREGHTVSAAQGVVLIDGAPATAYAVEHNYCFVLGDNFYDSVDSRYLGFVSEDDITGKAVMIYWSWDHQHSTIRWNRILQSIH